LVFIKEISPLAIAKMAVVVRPRGLLQCFTTSKIFRRYLGFASRLVERTRRTFRLGILSTTLCGQGQKSTALQGGVTLHADRVDCIYWVNPV
jgi:hypothetical protein